MGKIFDFHGKRIGPRSITINDMKYTVREDSDGKIGIEITFKYGKTLFLNPRFLKLLASNAKEMISHDEDYESTLYRVSRIQDPEEDIVAIVDNNGIILEIGREDPVLINHDIAMLEDLCSLAINEHMAKLIF